MTEVTCSTTARYYDPRTGQFISPDTIVPDASNLLDYNRYLYTRGNPLKYSDPSGHCVEQGSRDVGDPNAECMTIADTILQQWDSSPEYWDERFQSKEIFEQYYRNAGGLNTGYLTFEYIRYAGSDAYATAHPTPLARSNTELFFDAGLIGGSISGGFFGFTAGVAVEHVAHESGGQRFVRHALGWTECWSWRICQVL